MSPDGRGRDPGRRALLKAGTALAGIAGLAGCTDLFQDGDDTETPAPARTVTPTATLTPAETATPMDTDAPTMTATDAPTPQGTETPTTTPTPTPTPAATETPTPTPDRDRIAASDGDADDSFGSSVAVTGDGSTALVGAAGDDDPNGDGAGSAYVFRESSTIAWSPEAKIAPDGGDDGDRFGGAAALTGDGTTALVGASQRDASGGAAGAAYVFERDGGDWPEQDRLDASDGDGSDRFGSSVALADDGTAALVGADGDGDGAGSAYLLERSEETWSERAKLAAGDDGDSFGSSVALAGDRGTALVGADGDEDPNGNGAGSAYVFSF